MDLDVGEVSLARHKGKHYATRLHNILVCVTAVKMTIFS